MNRQTGVGNVGKLHQCFNPAFQRRLNTICSAPLYGRKKPISIKPIFQPVGSAGRTNPTFLFVNYVEFPANSTSHWLIVLNDCVFFSCINIIAKHNEFCFSAPGILKYHLAAASWDALTKCAKKLCAKLLTVTICAKLLTVTIDKQPLKRYTLS